MDEILALPRSLTFQKYHLLWSMKYLELVHYALSKEEKIHCFVVPGSDRPMVVSEKLGELSQAVKVSQDVETFLQFLALSDSIQIVTSLVMIVLLKWGSDTLIGIWEIIWLFLWLLQSIPMSLGISAVF